MPLQAVIFDFDGVIADTTELQYRAWKRIAEEADIAFTRVDNERLRGLKREDSLRQLLGDHGVDEATFRRWLADKDRYFFEAVESTPVEQLAIPGVRRFLDEIVAAGLPVGLASSSRNARLLLDRLGLTGRFQTISDGYAAVRPKPAPDIFLEVARRLAVDPAQTAVFEDSAAGLRAALAGGFYVVGVGATAHLQQPHQVILDFSSFSLDDLP